MFSTSERTNHCLHVNRNELLIEQMKMDMSNRQILDHVVCLKLYDEHIMTSYQLNESMF